MPVKQSKTKSRSQTATSSEIPGHIRGRLAARSPALRRRSGRAAALAIGQALETNQRKMPERRHGAPFDHAHSAMALGPVGERPKAEFRPPAEPARQRRETSFEQAARAGFGADMIDQHDLAARPDDARAFIERR